MPRTIWNAWQKGMIALLNSKKFNTKLRELFSEHAPAGRDPDILIDAFRNYYTMKNPGFGSNHWYFSKTKTTFHTNQNGAYFATEDPEFETLCVEHSTQLAQAVGRDRWLKTFLARYPGN